MGMCKYRVCRGVLIKRDIVMASVRRVVRLPGYLLRELGLQFCGTIRW